ncbi:hypothetical protein [Bowmanella denitrificans]|uniref:hypothetical protein n=1 Tax=Bowmanella denitrificans TaxID=366582 RepID=UPI000C9CCFAE|nr:hypothetical protein [Bowmanella denitrificans]
MTTLYLLLKAHLANVPEIKITLPRFNDRHYVWKIFSAFRYVSIVLFSFAQIQGCSSFKLANMSVNEVFYIAVASGENTNYYRITVNAKSVLGEAEYQAGWYPSHAVDKLYGGGSIHNETRAILTEYELYETFNTAYKTAYQSYLTEAKNPDTSEEKIAKFLLTLKRLRALPGEGTPLPEGAREIEYDPSANMALHHAGQKFVIAFSSNPDQVLQNIKSTSESIDSGATIQRLSGILSHQAQSSKEILKVEKVQSDKFDSALVDMMQRVKESLKAGDEVTDKNVGVEQVRLRANLEALISLTETLL